LDEFEQRMREDHDMGSTKSTKHTLKSLGVKSFIPETVALSALVTSQLSPVQYLTHIKNYILQKNETSHTNSAGIFKTIT